MLVDTDPQNFVVFAVGVNQAAVRITGGTIDGTAVGELAAVAGAFTALSRPAGTRSAPAGALAAPAIAGGTAPRWP